MKYMPTKDDKKIIVERINNASKLYKNDLIGKTFLLIYEGKTLEVIFKAENFLHLCGVDTNLYAKEFYRKDVKSGIKTTEIGFSEIHPYKFAEIKTRYLPEALSILKRDSLVITNIDTESRTYKLGTTDFELVICFDEQLDDEGNRISDIVVPYSLRIEEISVEKYKDIYEVDFVLSKLTGTKEYSDIVFGDVTVLNEYLKNNNITQYAINIKGYTDGRKESEGITTSQIKDINANDINISKKDDKTNNYSANKDIIKKRQ